jgi:hypothetical protein
MDKINECNDRWLNIYYGDWHGEYGVYLPAIPTSRQEWRDMKNNAAWGDCASQASEIGTRQLLRSADEVGTGNADIQVALREACSLVPLHHMLAMLQGLWGNSNVRSRWKKGEHAWNDSANPKCSRYEPCRHAVARRTGSVAGRVAGRRAVGFVNSGLWLHTV